MKRILPPFLLVGLLLLAVACRDQVVEPAATPVSPTAVEARPIVKVALFGATSGGSALPARRALQGARLAFDEANEEGTLPFAIEGVASDTHEDPEVTSKLLAAVEEDPSYLGAIVWESPVESGTVAEVAQDGLPVLSTSPAGAAARQAYTSLVAADRAQAETAAVYIASTGVKRACVATDSLPRGAFLGTAVENALHERGVKVPFFSLELPRQSDYSELANQVLEEGCGVLYWGGGGTEGGIIAKALADQGADTTLVGADPLIGEPFIVAAQGSEDGAVATCSCVDVSINTDLDSQRFVQQYQSRYGNPPSAYAVEGWDAAQILIAAIRSGATDRESVGGYISDLSKFGGLGGSYELDAGPVRPTSLFEVQHSDWVWLGASASREGRT